MPSYTVDDLVEYGPPIAMALLLRCLKHGQPFVTYGEIGAKLEKKLKVSNIFPTQLGHVAGELMDRILEIDPKAPLINALITRPNGIPGKGIGSYLSNKYNNPRLNKWDKISRSRKLLIIERERKKVLRYKSWNKLNTKLFGLNALNTPDIPEDEADFKRTRYGGLAESAEHKKLKLWVKDNPRKIGISKKYGKGVPEDKLLSGDTVDVTFQHENSYKVVEVKSIKSANDDFQRGIYQCVKYRAVKLAENIPLKVNVEAILVTERKLPTYLAERARALKIKCKVVLVNK